MHQRQLKTGTELYESVIAPLSYGAVPIVQARHHAIGDRAHLFEVLEDIRERCINQGIYPIVHIEAHGNRYGLRLASAERVEWLELLDALTGINRACELNLLVAMSACWGADISRILHPNHPAPFWGTVGPAEKIKAGALLDSFSAFYRSYLTDFDGKKAIDAMRGADPNESRKMGFRNAEVMFRQIFFEFIARYSHGARLQERIGRVYGWISEYDPGVSKRETEVRAWIEQRLLEHRVHFERYKIEYFMYELFPKNKTRFDPQYEDGPPWSTEAVPDST